MPDRRGPLRKIPVRFVADRNDRGIGQGGLVVPGWHKSLGVRWGDRPGAERSSFVVPSGVRGGDGIAASDLLLMTKGRGEARYPLEEPGALITLSVVRATPGDHVIVGGGCRRPVGTAGAGLETLGGADSVLKGVRTPTTTTANRLEES